MEKGDVEERGRTANATAPTNVQGGPPATPQAISGDDSTRDGGAMSDLGSFREHFGHNVVSSAQSAISEGSRDLAARSEDAFDTYTTIDWPQAHLNENRRHYEDSRADSSGYARLDGSSGGDTNATNGLPMTANSAFQFLHSLTRGQVIKSRLWSSFQGWIVLTVIGVGVGTIAAFLNVMTELLNDLKGGYCERGLWLNESFCCGGEETCDAFKPWSNHVVALFGIHLVLCVAFGTLASYCCVRFAPFAAGSGISEVKVIVSGFNTTNAFLSLPTLVVKALMLPLTIASGIQVGKEGPSVHYAACCGAIFPKALFSWFQECPQRMCDFVTAASATGVAVAFGSPISGVVFALEEICARVSINALWKCFYAAFIGTSTLQAWDPFRTGQIVMFSVRFESDWKFWELPLFVLLGLFGGVYGVLVARWNIKYVAFRKRYFPNSGVLEVCLLCLLTGIVGYPNAYVRQDMTRVMEVLFTESASVPSFVNTFQLGMATAIRALFIVVSYGSKVPCGIFVPSMAVGATFGKLVGELLRATFPSWGVDSSIYAFLGAGAALSGITGLTVTVVVIMFELTGAVKYIVPTMATVLVVKCVLELGGHGGTGIADQMIKFNRLPYLDLREEHHLGNPELRVRDVMLGKTMVAFENVEETQKVVHALSTTSFVEYPIVTCEQKLLAIVPRKALDRVVGSDFTKVAFLDDATAFKLTGKVQESEGTVQIEDVRTDPLAISHNASLRRLLDLFMELGCRCVYVVDDSFTLVGCVTRKDMIRYTRACEPPEDFVTAEDTVRMDRVWATYREIGNLALNVPSRIRSVL